MEQELKYQNDVDGYLQLLNILSIAKPFNKLSPQERSVMACIYDFSNKGITPLIAEHNDFIAKFCGISMNSVYVKKFNLKHKGFISDVGDIPKYRLVIPEAITFKFSKVNETN